MLVLFSPKAQLWLSIGLPRPSNAVRLTPRLRMGNWTPFPSRNIDFSSFASRRMMSTIERPSLTHIDDAGHASMVDVGDKNPSQRTATATGRIYIPLSAFELITSTYPDQQTTEGEENQSAQDKAKSKARRKGDALTVAQLAAIMGSKRTSDLIPLCHPLALSHVSVVLTPEANLAGNSVRHSVVCSATVSCEGKTGVEMEALTAVSVGLLTVWDMLKAVAGKEMMIADIMVTEKWGGKSGNFKRLN
jgi:molybdenum cofactor biosynthesis protein MoaC